MSVLLSRCFLLLLCSLLSGCIQAQQQTATYFAYSDTSCQDLLFNQTISFSNVTTTDGTTLSTSNCTALSGPGDLSHAVLYCAHSSDQFTYAVAGFSNSSCSGNFSTSTASNTGSCSYFPTGNSGSVLVQCNAAMARQQQAAAAALAVAVSVLVLTLL